MIYSQTPIHNGVVRVSGEADGDCSMLTFLVICHAMCPFFMSSSSSSFLVVPEALP